MPSRAALAVTTVLLAVAAWLAWAPAVRAVDPVNTTWRGIAIDGYDPVAYFTDGRAVEGEAAHTFVWHDATWRFASAEHRDQFAADPERWAPQFRGYCAYAVSQGKTAGIDPEAWKIVDGKLYLNYSAKIQARWKRIRQPSSLAPETNWPRLLDD